MSVALELDLSLDHEMLRPGEMLNQYRIDQCLGSGACGVVYRAYDLRLERKVALKLLARHLQTDTLGWGRLLREARAASRLSHPCLCSIYDVAEERGHTYLAMEYVEGEALRQIIPAGGLPVAETLNYGEQLAGALAHVHERGIIHRDIKSSNVIITPRRQAKLLDFGLALRVHHRGVQPYESSSWSSQEGIEPLGGTLPYMAPEVLRGERAGVQSDLWSLGVLLYEMLSGKLPFVGKTSIEVGAAILTEPIPALPRNVPAQVAALVDSCLEKDGARRYAAATELNSDLRKASADVAKGAVKSALICWCRGIARWPRMRCQSREPCLLGPLNSPLHVCLDLGWFRKSFGRHDSTARRDGTRR